MDLLHYIELKEKGAVSVAKVGKVIGLAVSEYDPYSGELKEPSLQSIKLKDFEALRAQKLKDIENLDALIADIKALEE